MLQKCRCRETFSEIGPWVAYPKALLWAVKEWETVGVDSWIIRYPLAGFSQILRWFDIVQLPVDAAKIEVIKNTKLIHHVVTIIMDGLLRENHSDKSWTYPSLQLVYSGFNASGIPCDLGADSLMVNGKCWDKLEIALGPRQDVKRFLSFFNPQAREAMVSRIQLVTFWALFTQKGHTTAKTFFANITAREPLATACLDPRAILPQDEVRKVLMSIFCDKARLLKNLTTGSQEDHLGTVMPPFASPFGASVLRCGFPGCSVDFFSPNNLNKKGAEETAARGIRMRRAEHFARVYGIPGAFDSQTGLPDLTLAPKAPTSYHNTLHISTARAWSRLTLDQKQGIISGSQDPRASSNHDAIVSFVADVRHELCANSRWGNIYSATIDDEVRTILPSFFEALSVASDKMGLNKSGVEYVHDWTENTIVRKMKYELGL
ncbi:MAG: hypothetical protein L6R40_001521 [Gallowayella cf. fulva]|nr:MAG: hypothetical protein L6R40_001521 [Xanthomendoza cf. fulva]